MLNIIYLQNFENDNNGIGYFVCNVFIEIFGLCLFICWNIFDI